MATTNYQFNDARIAKLVYDELGDSSADLSTSIDFEPVTSGIPLATVTVTRTYKVPVTTAREWLKTAL
jgi:hypothetical protein